MDMLEYMDNNGTEEQCRQHLFNSRWPKGFICPKCGHTEYFDIKSRNLFQCKSCNHQVSVTAATIMYKTRTPLRKWFLAFYYMSGDKSGISALALKDKIKVSYQTAWSMCHKIRSAMAERDSDYSLNGIVEIDEAFFGSPTEGGKRGCGTDKTAVFVSVSLTEDGNPEYARMKGVEVGENEAVNGETALKSAVNTIAKGDEVRTDGLNIYNILSQNGFSLNAKKYDPENNPEHLHWIHIIISNVKALIEGTFHGLDAIHLQRFLNEFCYRFNRRWLKDGVFSNLVKA